MIKSITLTLISLLLTTTTLARTDLSGCTSSISGASIIWYVPGTGELCQFLDCGGGTALPKTDVPGCPLYSGTATYSPSYLEEVATTGTGADTWAMASQTGSSTRQGLFTSVPAVSITATPETVPTTATVSATATETLGLTMPAHSLSGVSSATSVSSAPASVSNSETASTSTSTGPVSTGAAARLKMNSDMRFSMAVAVAGLVGAAVL